MASLTYDEAAHLLRRMGFGGPPEEIDDLTTRGREGAVDYLINYSQIDNSALDTLIQQSFNFSNPQDNGTFNLGEIRRWWYTRMVHSKRQFEEKLTLFWHDHFATSSDKVNFVLMYNQNLTLRKYALGRFDDLLLYIAKDPAMLVWLDGITNILGKPQENFAREIQELFSLGITDFVTGETNYTENDIKEIARAFTGWKYRGPRAGESPLTYTFFVQDNQHDNGQKRIYPGTPYETAGNLSGDDVVNVIASRRETARYLTWKLFNYFVYPLTDSSEDKNTVDRFSKVYVNNTHSIKELLRAIFTSDEFFSERAFFSLVKQPIELVVGAVRMLGAQYVPGSVAGRNASNPLSGFAARQGQTLFTPPDVAGWDKGINWVNTSYMLERFNFANSLVTNRNFTGPGVFVTNDQLKSITKSSAKKTVKRFLSRLGPLSVGKDARGMLQTYLGTGDTGQAIAYVNDEPTVDKKIRGLVHQIMCLPEFNLN